MAEKKSNAVQQILSVVVLIGMVWFFFGGGLEQQTAKDMQKIHYQVAADSTTQYEIVKRSGRPAEVCFHAGTVAAAYLQAKDEPNYQRWKKTESEDCQRAGMPK